LSDATIIQGNYLGTTAAGIAAIPNDNDAIFITNGADNTIVGGALPGEGNLISGNNGYGVSMSEFTLPTSGNQVLGNFIGTDATGLQPIPNDGGVSIFASSNNMIGGAATGAGNRIAFNLGNGIDLFGGGTRGDAIGNTIIRNTIIGQQFGISLRGSGTSATNISANFIGTDATGLTNVGNGADAISIGAGAHDNTIGGTSGADANEIAFNRGNGIAIDSSARGIAVLRNSIHDNTGLGIDLNNDGATANDIDDADIGANDLINHPVITAVYQGDGDVISGTIVSRPNTTLRIEVFSADSSTLEGAIYRGSRTVTTDASGAASFQITSNNTLAQGSYLTATATELNGAGTSEFGAPFQVGGLPPGARVNIADVAITEGQSGSRNAIFTVTLSEAATQTVTVDFSTADLSARAADNDYLPASGTVSFAPGQLSATISVAVNGDTAGEARERFVVHLSNALNASIEDDQATGVIRDDDHHLLVTGSAKGSLVQVFDATSGKLSASFEAFEPGYRGGVRVATGDVTGDGVNDIIAGGGVASGARVRVFDGVTLEPLSGVLGDFDAFGRFYRGGVYVAAGDVNGDGRAEVIVSPSAGGSGQVRIFSGADGAQLSGFTAFGKGSGGVRVAAGDIDGDGRAELIAGAGLGSTVRIFDAMAGTLLESIAQNEFRAFGRKFRGGVYVAAGDVNGDGLDDVIAGASSGERVFRVFHSPPQEGVFEEKEAYAGALRGVRVSTVDVNSDGIADIVAGKGRGDAKVTIFNGDTLARLLSLSGYPTGGKSGIFVG
jgi:hypothetical protein